MTFVIKLLALGGKATIVEGSIPILGGTPQYVKGFYPERYGGRGWVEATADPCEAIQFDDKMKAMALYRTVPKNRPTREDGKPNRPMTAFTIEILSLDDALKESDV